MPREHFIEVEATEKKTVQTYRFYGLGRWKIKDGRGWRSINAIFSLKSYLPFDVLPGWQRLRELPLEEPVKVEDPVPMNFVQPGGVALAAVAVPESAYPNSDLASAFFNVSVNKALSAEQCGEFSVPQANPATPVSRNRRRLIELSIVLGSPYP